ncbi:hypothetical protein RJT34_00409 [Clitoria ternatea]|uniref:Uncharacterized protein n=1 Tax=Clitoria ternatea TaxID=43366 RepID=A0AAN9KIE1_CLITE
MTRKNHDDSNSPISSSETEIENEKNHEDSDSPISSSETETENEKNHEDSDSPISSSETETEDEMNHEDSDSPISSSETEIENDFLEKRRMSSSKSWIFKISSDDDAGWGALLRIDGSSNTAIVNMGPTASQSTSSSRGRKHSEAKPFWSENWTVHATMRASGKKVDKSYRHKTKNITCRSMKEIERYETYGILPGSKRNSADQKEQNERRNKRKQTKEMLATEQRRMEANNMKAFVEEFLAKAHFNQLHMFDDMTSNDVRDGSDFQTGASRFAEWEVYEILQKSLHWFHWIVPGYIIGA